MLGYTANHHVDGSGNTDCMMICQATFAHQPDRPADSGVQAFLRIFVCLLSMQGLQRCIVKGLFPCAETLGLLRRKKNPCNVTECYRLTVLPAEVLLFLSNPVRLKLM